MATEGTIVVLFAREGSGVSGEVRHYHSEDDYDLQDEVKEARFPTLLARVAEALQKFPDAAVEFRRSDAASRPTRLAPELRDLLATDFVEAIRLLSFESQKVDLSKLPPKKQFTTLVIGYDVLSASIGDYVTCRRREERIECPGCGVWRSVSEGSLHCPSLACGTHVGCEELGPTRWRVRTSDLLDVDLDRYFLPLRWSASSPWLSHQDLKKMFNNWKTLKEGLKW